MARKPKPSFWAARQAYFVTLDGARYNLGTDEDAAHREYFRLRSLPPGQRAPKAAIPSTGLTVADIFDRFLDWTEKHRAPRTYDWYLDHIQSFTNFLPDPAGMPVTDLKPYHVVEWADKYPSWGDNFRRGAIVAIQRPIVNGARIVQRLAVE